MNGRNLGRRVGSLESAAAEASGRNIEMSAGDLLAGRIPRGWSLLKAIRASYGYDPNGDEPIGPQLPNVWKGAAA